MAVSGLCKSKCMPETETVECGIAGVCLFGFGGKLDDGAVVVAGVVVVELLIIFSNAAVAANELPVVLVVAYKVGKIRVGKSHENHVAIVICLRSVSLAVVDAVEHIECLNNFGEGGVVVGKAMVALERKRDVADAIVEDIACVEKRNGGERVDGVECLLCCGKVFEIIGDTMGIVRVSVFRV